MEQEQKTKLDKESLITFRFMKHEDKPFIFSTWLKGLKFGNSWYKLIEDQIYYDVYHKVIESIINKHSVSVKIACLKEDPDVILGYAVFEENRLHWVHVKKVWRRIGLATDMVPGRIGTVSHLTAIGKIIFLKKRLIFNPFMII